MDNFANLEIGLHQQKDNEYRVDFRLSLPNSDADIRERSNQAIVARFDLNKLRALVDQPEAYGKELTKMLFADPALRVAFASARKDESEEMRALRLRLFIGPSATTLHSIRWELLQDPETDEPLSTDEFVIFSRYLPSMDDRPVRLKQKGNLRALVFVASPKGADEIDPQEEIRVARNGMKGISLKILPDPEVSSDPPVRATLENLVDALRADPEIDVLYMALHGVMADGEPYLLFEDADGKLDRVEGRELVLRLQQVRVHPRLVVLLSCQSAGTGTGDALSALGPRLADIGIPAVVAMQHDFAMDTAKRFMPKFFRELQNDGQIDRAMAAARGSIRYDCEDAWVPVLFMRLKSGRLWYKPGFSDIKKASQRMPAMLENIENQKLTPILGPGLVEPVLGSLREIARRWATDFSYPMLVHERESLPQVAQFLSINQQPSFPRTNLEKSLKDHITKSWLGGKDPKISLNKMIEQVVTPDWSPGGLEPHQYLARLNLPIYITANQDSLLEAALCYEGKQPRTVLCPWNEFVEQPGGLDLNQLAGEALSVQEPIVFHLFGSWDNRDSVILTEDDYFKFMLRLTSDKNTIPLPVRTALSDSGLVFLGFQVQDWVFRVLIHSLLSLSNTNRRERYAHIAAQIEMEDERIVEPAMARRYLEQYFTDGAKIDIYWGNPEEFIQELASKQGA